jgi:formylmethanofuran dehydrogenase subunit A
MAYPQIIRLLMDRSFRDEMLAQVNPKVLDFCGLKDMTREYSLSEIAIITRSGPAKLLGLPNKGHLGVGADADIAIYREDDDKEKMFAVPRYVIKSGQILVEDFEIRNVVHGKTLATKRDFDPAAQPEIEQWFSDQYSVSTESYGIAEGDFTRTK